MPKLGCHHSEKTKRRLSQAAKRREDHIAALCKANLANGRYLPIGAVRTTSKGYLVEKIAHRKAQKNWRAQHRVVMERHLKRSLERTETVHHINNDVRDNRIENLVVMTSKEHSMMNHLLAFASRCDERVVRIILQTMKDRFPEINLPQ